MDEKAEAELKNALTKYYQPFVFYVLLFIAVKRFSEQEFNVHRNLEINY